jgi:hypothetical protein
MFSVGTGAVYQWTLGTPWSLTGSVTSGTTYSLSAVETGASGLTFSADGTKMVVVGNTAVANGAIGSVLNEDRAYYFTLSSAWDPSSATLASSIRFGSGDLGLPAAEGGPVACAYDNTGSNFYMLGNSGDKVYQYALSTPYVVSTTTAVYSKQLSISTDDGVSAGLAFNNAGTRMYMVGQTYDMVWEYRLSTAWDVTTAVLYDKFFVGYQNGTMQGIYVNDTATNYVFLVGSTAIYRYRTDTQGTVINPESTSSSIVLYGNTRVKNNNLYVDSNVYAGGSLVSYTNSLSAGTSGVTGGVFTGITTGGLNIGTGLTTGNLVLSSGQSTGATTIGSTAGTGAITIGQSTGAQTLNLATGASTTATTKTINIGTNGISSSTTSINIGSAVAGALGTLTINSTQTVLASTTTAVSTTTGALRITGGVGVGGDLYASGLYDNNARVITTSTLGNYGVNSIAAGTGISLNTTTGAVTVSNIGVTSLAGSTYLAVSVSTGSVTLTNLGVQTLTAGTDTTVSSSTGTVTIWSTSTLQTVTGRGATTTAALSITNSTSATSTNSGALQIVGGVGVGGALYAGNMYSNGNAVITSASLGSYGVSSLTGSTYIAVSTSTGNVTLTNLGVQTLTAGTDTVVTSSTGTVTVYNTSTLQSVTGRGATTNNIVYFTAGVASNAYTTGTVIVTGGVGISGNIYINGTLNTNGATSLGSTLQHYGLIPTAGTSIDQIYTTSTSLTLSTNWQNTGISGSSLTTGTYMVQVLANDSGVGGGEVNTYYSGVMSWYAGNGTEVSFDEIPLHRAGSASGTGTIFLQVLRASGSGLALQIAGTTNNSGSSTYSFSFRRMI